MNKKGPQKCYFSNLMLFKLISWYLGTWHDFWTLGLAISFGPKIYTMSLLILSDCPNLVLIFISLTPGMPHIQRSQHSQYYWECWDCRSTVSSSSVLTRKQASEEVFLSCLQFPFSAIRGHLALSRAEPWSSYRLESSVKLLSSTLAKSRGKEAGHCARSGAIYGRPLAQCFA